MVGRCCENGACCIVFKVDIWLFCHLSLVMSLCVEDALCWHLGKKEKLDSWSGFTFYQQGCFQP